LKWLEIVNSKFWLQNLFFFKHFLAQQKRTVDKKRYSVDFLLERADAFQSKQIPKDWPDLNMKYPNICFCGRVSKKKTSMERPVRFKIKHLWFKFEVDPIFRLAAKIF
jgi:hypothetical protein